MSIESNSIMIMASRTRRTSLSTGVTVWTTLSSEKLLSKIAESQASPAQWQAPPHPSWLTAKRNGRAQAESKPAAHGDRPELAQGWLAQPAEDTPQAQEQQVQPDTQWLQPLAAKRRGEQRRLTGDGGEQQDQSHRGHASSGWPRELHFRVASSFLAEPSHCLKALVAKIAQQAAAVAAWGTYISISATWKGINRRRENLQAGTHAACVDSTNRPAWPCPSCPVARTGAKNIQPVCISLGSLTGHMGRLWDGYLLSAEQVSSPH